MEKSSIFAPPKTFQLKKELRFATHLQNIDSIFAPRYTSRCV